MNDRSDQPRDPESGQVPPHAGAEDPTVEQPRPDSQETVAAPAEAAKPAEPVETAKSDDAVKPAEPVETAANAQQAPPAAGQVPPVPGQAPYGTPPPGWVAPAGLQAPPRQGGFRRFAGNRATQLVGVGLVGMLIGGGIVGGVAAATFHNDGGRPGVHRSYDGNTGPGGRDLRGGPGFDGGGRGGGYGG